MADQASWTAPPPANLQVSRVTRVKHYTEGLFAFRCERPASFRFRSGEFVMIGLMNGAKPLLRAYSIASPAWDDQLAFYSIKAPEGPLTSRLQHIRPGDEILIGRKPTGTLVLDKGAYCGEGGFFAQMAAMHACGPYKIENINVESSLNYSNTQPSSSIRARSHCPSVA